MGMTDFLALSWAILNKRYDVSKMLILAGASLEDTDLDCGYTPIFYAVYVLSIELIELLIRHGSNAKACDRSGRTVLEFIY